MSETEVEISIPDPFQKEGEKKIKVKIPVPCVEKKYSEFDPQLYQYAKLREKMCIKIRVKVLRSELIDISMIDDLK